MLSSSLVCYHFLSEHVFPHYISSSCSPFTFSTSLCVQQLQISLLSSIFTPSYLISSQQCAMTQNRERHVLNSTLAHAERMRNTLSRTTLHNLVVAQAPDLLFSFPFRWWKIMPGFFSTSVGTKPYFQCWIDKVAWQSTEYRGFCRGTFPYWQD